MKNTESYTRVGQTRFRLEQVKSQRLSFVAETVCIRCGGTVHVPYGVVAAVFRVGPEFVGISCDACVDTDTRERLARLRERGKAMSR